MERCLLTKHWSLKERASLAGFLEKQNLKKDEHLFFEKTSERKLYIIDSGVLKIQCGNLHIELESGDSIGELSLLSNTQKQVSALALEDCFFWVITEKNWEKIRKEQPGLAYKLIESINKKFAELVNTAVPPPKLSGLSASSPETKPTPGLMG